MRLSPRSNTLYACTPQDPARILYLCNTASPLDATTSIPTHLSQRMSKTTTTCPVSWRGAFQIVLAVAAFFMVDPYIRKLLSFVQEHCIAELSPYGFGAFVVLLAGYLLKREWHYRKIYVPRPVSLWLILLLGIYLYYRHWEGSFSFWLIPYLGKLAWSDLLLLPIAFCLLQACKKKDISVAKQEVAPEQMGVQPIQNDVAIKRECDDWLGFSATVKVLFEDLCLLDLRRESLTMGVIAEWGKGKSSFINLLINKVEVHGDIIIRFNPRGSKSAANIQEDFFDTFATELSKYYAGFGFLLGRYTKHLGLLGQYEWTRPLESLLTLLLPEKDNQAINDALYAIGRRVYVVIDDLDRLTGEEIIEVLKLVDRNASFNNVVFVMAYDKQYVNNVLRKHLDHGLDHSFIDKYVTWEVILPKIDSRVFGDKMKLYLGSYLLGLPDEEKKRVLEGWVYVGSIIVEDLASVRHLKRYMNITLPRYREVYSRVDPADFFLLSLLQYRYLTIYNKLARHIAEIQIASEQLRDSADFLQNNEVQRILGELPSDALSLIRSMFFGWLAGRGMGIRMNLIRSNSYPYYFRYAKDKAEEE